MSADNPVTLQISLAPSDYRHGIHLLAHQIGVFEPQVDEILLTYDTHRSKGRFAANWEENNERFWKFLVEFAAKSKKIKLLKIDYSSHTALNISKAFFNRQTIPAKDWRGGPFYTYFFGLFAAKHDYVIHIDSDMFFGGLSKTWVREAIAEYLANKAILFINPLAGPPKEDGTLNNQVYTNYRQKPFYFCFKSMSTRIFFVDRSRLRKYPLHHIMTRNWKEMAKAIIRKNPPYRLPEEILTDVMKKHHLFRLDFKGAEPGLWSIHPPYRSNTFYSQLPELIQRIEDNDIPDSQKGHYDIINDLIDWTEAKRKL